MKDDNLKRLELWSAKEVRNVFLQFFESKGHHIAGPIPVITYKNGSPQFTKAGVDQFSDILMGKQTADFSRITNTQPCISLNYQNGHEILPASDVRHHSMFEMLGSWGFGDYFKKDSIAWAWELLTEVYQIDRDRLYVVFFGGDKADGLPADSQTLKCWKEFLPDSHIIKGNKANNFTSIPGTDLAGPSSAIIYDNRSSQERKSAKGSMLVHSNHPQVIELWKIVFIEYHLTTDSFSPLDNKYVDTGMGLERLISVVQNKSSNYETDLFSELIDHIKSVIGIGQIESADMADGNIATSMRVVADHSRAIAFMMADSGSQTNEKAGKAFDWLIQSAIEKSYVPLGIREPFIHGLVPIIAQQFRGVYDGIWNKKEIIEQVVWDKEDKLFNTLNKSN